jgi:predicted O-methyltransferase YrrM
MQPSLKHFAAVTAFLAICFVIAGGVIVEARYWLISASVAFAFATQVIMLRVLINRHWTTQHSIEGISGSIVQNLPSELHAMHVILNRFPECSIPTTSWSMRFSNLLSILDLLDTHQPELVVEFGSGISTLMIAAWMKENACGKIISFDHDRNWSAITRRHLVREGLADYSEVIDAPLKRVESLGHEGDWYDITCHLDKLPRVDMLIVDGPPAGVSDKWLSRLPALDKLHGSFASSCVVVLDDALRPGETEVVRRWTEAFSEFTANTLHSATGLAVLTRTPQVSSRNTQLETVSS